MSYLSKEMMTALEKIQSSLVDIGENISVTKAMGCASCEGGCSGGCDGCSGGCQGGCTGCESCSGGCQGYCTGAQ
ncbi:MAG: hypothetical protein LBI14_04030 [Treponema sp.]|nr:hypothetical protein [Treponema sp.]